MAEQDIKPVDKPKKTKKAESPKVEEKAPEAEVGQKESPKTEASKPEKKKKAAPKADEVKEKAIANAPALNISPKQSKFICRMIRRKTPDRAIVLLDGVIAERVPVKMTGLEVGHQKGKGISGARYPKTAAAAIKEVVKQLKANASVNGIEEPIITLAVSNQASAPLKKGGRRAKRTSLHLEARDKTKLLELKK